jgi:hypothetical protein
MRRIFLLIASSLLASCMTGPPPPPQPPTPEQVQEYQKLVGGKVAQAPISCLPNFYSNDMRTIDGRTLGFRMGQSRAYIVRLSPGCELLDRGGYTLLSRQPGGMGLCQNDIQEVVDLRSHMHVGSCVVASITPYYRP